MQVLSCRLSEATVWRRLAGTWWSSNRSCPVVVGRRLQSGCPETFLKASGVHCLRAGRQVLGRCQVLLFTEQSVLSQFSSSPKPAEVHVWGTEMSLSFQGEVCPGR